MTAAHPTPLSAGHGWPARQSGYLICARRPACLKRRWRPPLFAGIVRMTPERLDERFLHGALRQPRVGIAEPLRLALDLDHDKPGAILGQGPARGGLKVLQSAHRDGAADARTARHLL